jgi:serine/threonine protein phosphatase PrpC
MVTLPAWRSFAATARGALHVRTGLPNQDAHGMRVTSRGALVVAVADGHGDPRCTRADVGSRLAVQVALDGADQMLANQGGTPAMIATAWRAAVDRHLNDNPWSSLDQKALDGEAEPYTAYGSTLVMTVLTPTTVLVLRIGDGDLLIVSADGTTRRPVVATERLVGGETWSLAAPDADRRAEVVRTPFEEDTRLMLLATDGYANSFASEDWDATIGADYLRLLDEHGPDWMERSLSTWAEESAAAAGDDVTLLLVVCTP